MLIIMMMIVIAMMMTLDFERCVSAPWPQAGQQTNWPRHHFHLGEPGRPSTYHHMKGELRDPTHHPKDDSFGITFTFLSLSHVLAFSPESELKDLPNYKECESSGITCTKNHFHIKQLSLSYVITVNSGEPKRSSSYHLLKMCHTIKKMTLSKLFTQGEPKR